jgi:two-component system response regulator HydG
VVCDLFIRDRASPARVGLPPAAEGGTLFLDEIGELPAAAQVKFLRFVQDRSYYRLGETQPRRSDVRIVAATNQRADDSSPLRSDLLMRFGPEPIALPPLAERPEDLAALACHFLAKCQKRLSARAMRLLHLHGWPGNVRELEKTVEFAAASSGDRTLIDVADLPARVRQPRPPSAPETPLPGRPRPSREVLERLLQQHGGNVPSVARHLGRYREQIWRWCRQDGLDPRRYR